MTPRRSGPATTSPSTHPTPDVRSAPEQIPSPGTPVLEHRNEIVIVGRLSAPSELRELPSGDQVSSWRLVVDRAGGTAGARFDVLDCTAWTARLRRSSASWAKGDLIEVHGALRRRFWRGPAGPVQSRYEVEVAAARRVVATRAEVSRRRAP